MQHTATRTFADLFAPMDARMTELLAQIDELAGTISAKKAANELEVRKTYKHKTKALEDKFERLRKEYEEVREAAGEITGGTSAKLTHYTVCKIRAEQDGTTWSKSAEESLKLPRAQHEGWGEKAVRIMRGLPLDVTQGKRDMDDGEIKKLDNGHGGLQTVQVGECGTSALFTFVWDLNDQAKSSVSSEVAAAFKRGEVPKELINGPLMPAWLKAQLLDALKPSKILGQYGDIYCVFEFGYVVIPQADVDDAWELVSVTKGKPRYALKKIYSVKKMLECSASTKQ